MGSKGDCDEKLRVTHLSMAPLRASSQPPNPSGLLPHQMASFSLLCGGGVWEGQIPLCIAAFLRANGLNTAFEFGSEA